MVLTYDADRRLRRRILNCLVVESSSMFMFYMQESDIGLAPDLIPLDPYDLDISVRQWKKRLHQYRKCLKHFYAERNAF